MTRLRERLRALSAGPVGFSHDDAVAAWVVLAQVALAEAAAALEQRDAAVASAFRAAWSECLEHWNDEPEERERYRESYLANFLSDGEALSRLRTAACLRVQQAAWNALCRHAEECLGCEHTESPAVDRLCWYGDALRDDWLALTDDDRLPVRAPVVRHDDSRRPRTAE